MLILLDVARSDSCSVTFLSFKSSSVFCGSGLNLKVGEYSSFGVFLGIEDLSELFYLDFECESDSETSRRMTDCLMLLSSLGFLLLSMENLLVISEDSSIIMFTFDSSTF